MPSITCDCGFVAEDADQYKVEAKIWHHAIKEHLEMLKQMTPEQIEGVLKNNDEQMKI